MRIRTIKPEFWSHPVMSRLSDATKLLAIGLLNYADDDGYFFADSKLIRSALRPLDDDSSNVRASLNELAGTGYLELSDSPSHGPIGRIVSFSDHQRIDRAKPSSIKGLYDSTNIRRLIDDKSSLEGKGREGKGTGELSAPVSACVSSQQPDENELPSLKAAPSTKAEGTPSSAPPRKPHLHWEVAYGVEMPESLRTENCLAAVKLWLQHKTEKRDGYKPTGLKMALTKWSNEFTAASFPLAVENSIACNYAGIFPPKPQQQSQSSPQKPKPVWLQIKELEARIESHVANHNRLGYDSSKSTPEAKEEWKRMKQALKDLQAGQPQAEEGAIP